MGSRVTAIAATGRNFTANAKRLLTKKFSIKSAFNTAKSHLLQWTKAVYGKTRAIFFENFYGVWIAKPVVSVAWYVIAYFVFLGLFVIFDQHAYTRRFLHSDGSNEIVIGITTILLALLVPVAIALVEDARKSSLERQAIIRNIIRLAWMPGVLLGICLFLMVPKDLHIFSVSMTIRTAIAALVLCCVYFIVMGFFRAYKWLADGSVYSSGSPETPPPDSPMPEAFTSYRFAQIIKLLDGAKGYETWIAIWQQWFPPEYENALHAAFFRRQEDILKNHKVKRYIVLSLELEAYAKYYDKRNSQTWWFTSDYLKRFLIIYAQVDQIIERDRGTEIAVYSGLWRAKSALESLLKRMIDEQLQGRDRSWNLFEAMGEYLDAANLMNLEEGKRVNSDTILTYFITQVFELLLSDRLESFSIRSDLVERDYWLVTYENLYVKRLNVSFVVEQVFKEWLFKKLNDLDKIENPYGFDAILDVFYLGSDLTIIADMYWFMYLGKNTTDADDIIKRYYQTPRPFGVFSRVTVSNWVEDENQRMANYADMQNREIDNAARLFAIMYYVYFEQFWKLPDLIKAVQKALRRKTLEQKERWRLEALLDWLKRIDKFYKSERAKVKKKPKE